MKKVLVIGGGFAGLWSAVSAARKFHEDHTPAEVTLVNRDANHSIRVRNYEENLEETLVPLPLVLDPIGVKLIVGEAIQVDTTEHFVGVIVQGQRTRLDYDKLILAGGSQLYRPAIPGLAEYSFDIDTYGAALRLQMHVENLGRSQHAPGQYTAVVIGSGATGVEIATELPARLRNAALASSDKSDSLDIRVILVDRGPKISGQLGGAQPVIEEACRDLGIELITDASLNSMTAHVATLSTGQCIPTQTVIWCAGMRANKLNECIPAKRDAQGRLFVDKFLKVEGVEDVFASGDAAHLLIDGNMPSVMSCQHARPMGRYAGNNAACALLNAPLAPLTIDWYTNIMDLGPWGAVYTEGWTRDVKAIGEVAKKTKIVINRQRIYPPLTGDRDQILQASSLDLQRPPSIGA